MKIFEDMNGNIVRLDFSKNAFSKPPEHVLVLCRYQGKWLLTNHKQRGLEFPGGKVEYGETLEQAARREVLEETGGRIKDLFYIGEYEVCEGGSSFVKAIFLAEVEELEEKEHYYETKGPVLFGDEIAQERMGESFSFIMKDAVIEESFQFVSKIMKK